MSINFKKILRETILKEEEFHTMKVELTFTFDLHHDVGGHTKLRKWRHGTPITDDDIIDLLEEAKNEIIYGILDGSVINRRRFIVSRNGGDYLNIVVLPEQLTETEWNLVTITVMKNDNFTVSKGQHQIFV